MKEQIIEEFGRLLMENVRDRAIDSCVNLLTPQANGPTARNWKKSLSGLDLNFLKSSVIPDCVDEALFQLLHSIDSGGLRLSFTSEDGKVVDLHEDGMSELAGWLMTCKDGWRQRYSQEPFYDFMSDQGHSDSP